MRKHRIMTIIGARPQFIKAAALSRAIRDLFAESLEEIIVHTGQHYDENMSKVFFEELGIPAPAYNLEVGSGSHAWQTGEIMRKAEQIMLDEKPRMVVVYGDTNTTIAGALAAAKLHIPVAHVEAGLRSFNKTMPEEINRIVADHTSTLLFSPTITGIDNLEKEGFRIRALPPYSADNPAVLHCGDVMYDNVLYYLKTAEKSSEILDHLELNGKDFILCTIHRPQNTDSSERLNNIMGTLNFISRERHQNFILPVHPRTAKMLPHLLDNKILEDIGQNPFFRIIEPVAYFDMLMLESRCRMMVTDSGGVQKESYFFQKPCLVLRPESEWKEIIELGSAVLVDTDPEKILKAFDKFSTEPPSDFPPVFGDGKASEFILREIVKFLHSGLQE